MSTISKLASLKLQNEDRLRSMFGAKTRSRTGLNYVDPYSRNRPRATPTGSRPQSKVGPRQTTTNDLRRVATYGRAAIPSTSQYQQIDPRSGGLPSGSPFGPYEMTPQMAEQIQAGIIGGPGPGYGEDYGGLKTRTDYLAAIEGEAAMTRELADLAYLKAQEGLKRRAGDYASSISPELSRSASMAGVRPGANLSEAERAKLLGGYERVQEFGRSPDYAYLRGPQEEGPLIDPATGQAVTANQIMRMAYESMLEAPTTTAEEQALLAEEAALQNVNVPGVQRLLADREVAGPRQMAELIENTPLYEYARQIAEARYGMDPNQAAGIFTPAMDIAYGQEQEDFRRSQQNFYPVTEAENIFDTYGPEGYDRYKQMLAEEAMYGSPSEQEAALKAQIEAENLETDLQLEATYGFRPSAIPNYSPDEVRQAFFDENFQDAVNSAVKTFGDNSKLTRADAEKIYNDYLETATGSIQGPINAAILEEILGTFITENPDFG